MALVEHDAADADPGQVLDQASSALAQECLSRHADVGSRRKGSPQDAGMASNLAPRPVRFARFDGGNAALRLLRAELGCHLLEPQPTGRAPQLGRRLARVAEQLVGHGQKRRRHVGVAAREREWVGVEHGRRLAPLVADGGGGRQHDGWAGNPPGELQADQRLAGARGGGEVPASVAHVPGEVEQVALRRAPVKTRAEVGPLVHAVEDAMPPSSIAPRRGRS